MNWLMKQVNWHKRFLVIRDIYQDVNSTTENQVLQSLLSQKINFFLLSF